MRKDGEHREKERAGKGGKKAGKFAKSRQESNERAREECSARDVRGKVKIL